MGMLGREEIHRRLGFHPATDVTIPLFEEARARFIELDCWLDETLPAGRDLAETHTQLQHTLWAVNATIACNLSPLQDPSTRAPTLVEELLHDRPAQRLHITARIPDGLPPEQVAGFIGEQVAEQLRKRSGAER